MKPFEVTVECELFRISERRQPGGALSYDIAWLDGPTERAYVFTVGKFTVGSEGHTSDAEARMTEEELLDEVRGFVLSWRAGEGGGA
ncbi:hypothetical protein [Arthrobacter antioxidans]|uniref:hypothetical protein n=1 Tax=Arthrobacter antioxidans TaxID=2895818 RepID=UPI001FFE8F6E|nr:hypothetical protein [Arthrobacter antioxidans]